MKQPFSSQLKTLRANANFTNKELARLAEVPESLISGLQNDNRRIGELQARKIAKALRLEGDVLEEFVLDAITNCSEKVLNEAKPYPAHLLNLLAVRLKQAGIDANSISQINIDGDPFETDITLDLTNGHKAKLKTQLVCN